MHRRTLTAIALGLTAATAVAATPPVVTPILPSGSATKTLCLAHHAGSQPAALTIEIVNVIGVVQATNAGTLPPGIAIAVVDPTPADGYCRVTGISAKRVRVTLCMQNASNNCIAVATAP